VTKTHYLLNFKINLQKKKKKKKNLMSISTSFESVSVLEKYKIIFFMLFDGFNVKILKNNLKKIIFIYFLVKNTLKKHHVL